ncbi:MAG: DUF4342 domain-containing protein [Sedimentibacter sp.]
MKVTIEQIDELRSRVNVSYEEAKKTLEKNEGDLIKSIIELEHKKGRKNEHHGNFTSFTNRLLALRMSVKNKENDTLLDLPLVLVLIALLVAFWIVIPGLILAVLASCKIKIYRDKNSINVDSLKKNMKETVDKIKEKSEIIIKEETKPEDNEESDNEIIIE